MLISMISLFFACGDKEDTASEPSGEPTTEPSTEASTEPSGEPTAEPSEETTGGTTDGGTTDEGTTDGGTTDEGTTDGGTTDEGTTDGGTTDEGTTDGGTTDGGSMATSYNAGDIVITEIMKNPCQVDPSDSSACLVDDSVGEWIELYNSTSGDVELQGFSFVDNGGTPDEFTVSSSLVVPAGGYVVLGASDDTSQNGSVNVDYAYDQSTFALGNGEDEVIVIDAAGNIIDEVYYNDANFPDDKGVSLTLNPDTLDATSNDDGANWCNATSEITTGGDLGTPGTANDACAEEVVVTDPLAGATCDAAFAGCTEADFASNDFTNETGTVVINMVGMQPYSPKCITLQVGQTVSIGATSAHPFAKVCAEDSVMDSQNGSDTAVEFTFTTAGYYNYQCGVHASMTGNIKVLP